MVKYKLYKSIEGSSYRVVCNKCSLSWQGNIETSKNKFYKHNCSGSFNHRSIYDPIRIPVSEAAPLILRIKQEDGRSWENLSRIAKITNRNMREIVNQTRKTVGFATMDNILTSAGRVEWWSSELSHIYDDPKNWLEYEEVK